MTGLLLTALLVTGLVATTASASAQVVRMEPGDKIRFSAGQSKVLHEARLERANPDSIILTSCNCTRLRFARAEVYDVEVFRGKDPGRRMLSGFGWGGLGGLAIAAVGAGTCSGGDKCDGWLIGIPAFALLGGLIGAVVGFLGAGSWQPAG